MAKKFQEGPSTKLAKISVVLLVEIDEWMGESIKRHFARRIASFWACLFDVGVG